MRKILPYLFISLILFGALGLSFAVPEAVFAQTGNAAQATGEPSGWGCVMGGLMDCLTFVLAKVANIILDIFGKVLDIAGAILNFAVDMSITRMSGLMQTIPMVEQGWKVFRDVANLFFIFVLLWTGLRMIITNVSADAGRKMVGWVVLMALLINFSLFITGAIIDSGNILTLHFYDNMRPTLTEQDGVTPVKDSSGNVVKAGLSDIYMEGLKLQTFFAETNDTFNLGEAGGFLHQNLKIIIAAVFGSVFILITAGVFLVAAYYFVVRAVVLMFLMMMAPLAFAAYALPSSKAKSLAGDWWSELFCQTYFAPLYMALAYVVGKAIQTGGFERLLHITNNQASFANVVSAPASENVGIIINYIFLIIIIGATTKIPKALGCKAGAATMDIGKMIGMGALGLVTGGVGALAARSLGGAAAAATSGLKGTTSPLGRAALRAADRLQNVKVGGGKSYKEQQEKGTFSQVGEEEAERNLTKGMKGKPADQAAYLARLDKKMQGKMYEKMSARDRVAIEAEAVKSDPSKAAHFKEMRGKMSIEEQEKTAKAQKEAEKETKADKRKEELAQIAKEINALKPGTTLDPAREKVLKDTLLEVSEKEAAQLGGEIAKAIAPYLDGKQYQAIQSSNEWEQGNKDAVSTARYASLQSAVDEASDVSPPPAIRTLARTRARMAMGQFKSPKERAGLDEKLLQNEIVLETLTAQDLKEIQKQNSVSGATLAKMKSVIEGWTPTVVGAPPPTAERQRLIDFLASTAGKDLFG